MQSPLINPGLFGEIEKGWGILYSQIDWLTDWLTDCLFMCQPACLTNGRTDWLAGWLTDCRADRQTDLLTCSLTDWQRDRQTSRQFVYLSDFLTDSLKDWRTDEGLNELVCNSEHQIFSQPWKRLAALSFSDSYLWYKHDTQCRSCTEKNTDSSDNKGCFKLLVLNKRHNRSSHNTCYDHIVNGHTYRKETKQKANHCIHSVFLELIWIAIGYQFY